MIHLSPRTYRLAVTLEVLLSLLLVVRLILPGALSGLLASLTLILAMTVVFLAGTLALAQLPLPMHRYALWGLLHSICAGMALYAVAVTLHDLAARLQ